jgi:hypothetical protein
MLHIKLLLLAVRRLDVTRYTECNVGRLIARRAAAVDTAGYEIALVAGTPSLSHQQTN